MKRKNWCDVALDGFSACLYCVEPEQYRTKCCNRAVMIEDRPYICSREPGHEGRHIACNVSTHQISARKG